MRILDILEVPISGRWGTKVPRTLGDARHDALISFIINKRKEAGLKQSELAEKMKVYQSQIARIESGERRVDVVEFIKLSEILDFDPAVAIKSLVGPDETST